MLCKGRFKPRQTFEPPQLSPGRLTTAVAVAAPSNVHPRHRTSRLLGWLQVSQPVRCSLRSCQFPAHEKRLGSIDVYCLGWSIWRDKEHQCQTNHLKQGKYLKVFKISKDFQDHSGIFRHIQEQIDDEFFLKQLNWWMEHGTQTTLNIYIYNKLEVVAELCQTLAFLRDFPVAFTKLSTAVLLSAVTRIGKSTRPYLSETKWSKELWTSTTEV